MAWPLGLGKGALGSTAAPGRCLGSTSLRLSRRKARVRSRRMEMRSETAITNLGLRREAQPACRFNSPAQFENDLLGLSAPNANCIAHSARGWRILVSNVVFQQGEVTIVSQVLA